MPNKSNSFRMELQDVRNSYLQQVRNDRIDSLLKPNKNKIYKTELDRFLQVVRKERLNELSRPTSTKQKYQRPQSPKHIVSEAALTYEATDRIIKISRPKRFFSDGQEKIVPGSVKPEALEHQTTDKDYQLSTPRLRRYPHGSGCKEDPFSTSKAAMSYVATPRIIELAKPAERKF